MPRIPNDVYETPAHLAKSIVNHIAPYLHVGGNPFIVEPSCGSGSFVRACRDFWPTSYIHGVDIREIPDHGADKFFHMKWEEYRAPTSPNLIIGNPPFTFAEEHIKLAFDIVAPNGYVAFLLRLGFLGSKKRFEFWHEYHLSHLFPISGRPSFTGGGNDTNEYAMFVWQKGNRHNSQIMEPIWNHNGRPGNT